MPPRGARSAAGPGSKPSQHFYRDVSDADKVPHRSAMFHDGRGPGAVGRAENRARSAPWFLGMRIGISTDVTLTAGAGPLSCEIVHSPRTRGSGTYWRRRPMPGEPPGPSDPLDPAGLVGRAAEAAAIRRMLDGAPLVTVTGLPGVGKTAVSLAAARAAAAGFADDSLLLRLDTLRDEALLPHTIAAALRLPDQYTRSRLDVLVDQLRDRHLLLILDTCEHLLGACAALVAELLPPCPKMQVLATSREPLGCLARRRWRSAR